MRVGDMLYFFSYKSSPTLNIDIVGDIRCGCTQQILMQLPSLCSVVQPVDASWKSTCLTFAPCLGRAMNDHAVHAKTKTGALILGGGASN